MGQKSPLDLSRGLVPSAASAGPAPSPTLTGVPNVPKPTPAPVTNGYMAPGGAKGPEIDPTMPHSTDPAVEQKIREDMLRDQLRKATSTKAGMLRSPVPPVGSPEYFDRIDAIHGAQTQERNYNAALSHPQAIQTPEQMRVAQSDLYRSGIQNADAMYADAKRRLSSEDPAERAKAQADIQEAMRVKDQMTKRFGGGLSDQDVQTRIAGQKALHDKEAVAQQAGQSVVDWQRKLSIPFAQAKYDAALSGAQIPGAQNKAALSQYGAEKTKYDVAGGNPEIASSLVDVGKNNAAAAKSQSEAAKAIEEKKTQTVTQPGATPQEVRNKMYENYGIDQNYATRTSAGINSMNAVMSDFNTGAVSGGNFFGGGNEEHLKNIQAMQTDIDKLENMAKSGPDGAKIASAKANELLSAMPVAQNGKYHVNPGLRRGAAVPVITNMMQGIRDRLQALVGGQ